MQDARATNGERRDRAVIGSPVTVPADDPTFSTTEQMAQELAEMKAELAELRSERSFRLFRRHIERTDDHDGPGVISRRRAFGLLGGAAAAGAGLAVAGSAFSAGPAGATALGLNLITPTRAYDSRPSTSPATPNIPKTQIGNGQTRNTFIDDSGAIVPVSSVAVLGNITLINNGGPVFLTCFAGGTTQPTTSTINAGSAFVTIANSFTSKLSTDSFTNMAVNCGGGPTDYIVDIFGYY